MAKEKTACRNCERVMCIAQDGLCGGCWNRSKGLAGDEKEKALAVAREQFKGLDPGERAPQSNRGKNKTANAVSGKHSIRKLSGPLPATDALPYINVIFTLDDVGLMGGLEQLAKKYRRTPEQQLLWILEHELASESMLPLQDESYQMPVESLGGTHG